MPQRMLQLHRCRMVVRKRQKIATTPFARWFRNAVTKFAPTRSAKCGFQECLAYQDCSATLRVRSRMIPRNDRVVSVAVCEPYTVTRCVHELGLPSSSRHRLLAYDSVVPSSACGGSDSCQVRRLDCGLRWQPQLVVWRLRSRPVGCGRQAGCAVLLGTRQSALKGTQFNKLCRPPSRSRFAADADPLAIC